MKNIDIHALQTRIETMVPTLKEYQRRRYLSTEAKTIGYGGISLVSRISGTSRQTLREGVKELDDPDAQIMGPDRSRKRGGGRKPVWEEYPGILGALEGIVSAHTKGEPMRSLLWTNKSLRNLEKGLEEKGYEVCYRVVGVMLKMLGYGLQADKKTLTVTASHAERDKQFEHINTETTKAVRAGYPVLSIEAKKKENIGNFKNNGRTYQEKKTPIEVLDHDFPIAELGKARKRRKFCVRAQKPDNFKLPVRAGLSMPCVITITRRIRARQGGKRSGPLRVGTTVLPLRAKQLLVYQSTP